ncbi:MAG TPA: NADH-quinone oxidoreductase subunit NuoH [Deltaproteobacteria bacterium]|nr:NADH-quinone oxidoreductase subunit NuoH [Deltaproteobacteria bacterium]
MTEAVIEVAIIFIKVVVLGFILFSLPLPLTWIERKIAGHIQVRLGPFRVGPHGILQPFADMVKMLFKEDVIPEQADRFLFRVAPIISMVPVFMVFVAIPFGESWTIPFINKEVTLYVADMNVGLLYILAISGVAVYGIILGGWASNSKYALLGGLRSSAQMISYEVALTFACIGVVMLASSLNLIDIVKTQTGGLTNWNVFYLPVGPLWFIIFFIAGLAEINRIPFDLPEDEGTLAAGFHVEYSGIRFAYFMLAEYIAMVSMSVLAVVLFFGGWDDPTGLGFLPPIVWFLLKVGFFIYLFMWIRFTLPRYRYDQLMSIGWKILIPLSLLNILVTGWMII